MHAEYYIFIAPRSGVGTPWHARRTWYASTYIRHSSNDSKMRYFRLPDEKVRNMGVTARYEARVPFLHFSLVTIHYAVQAVWRVWNRMTTKNML